jgi:hypothetical protein
MFGAIIYREVADRPPRPGEKWNCQDWECPSWYKCRHHHGRSYDYVAMLEPRNGKPPLLRPGRGSGESQCLWFQYDEPREWNARMCCPKLGTEDCPGCDTPECPNRVTEAGRA